MMKKIVIILLVIVVSGCFFDKKEEVTVKMIDLQEMSINEIKKYANDKKLVLDIKEEYDYDLPKDKIISQSIKNNEIIKQGDKLTIIVSLGPIPVSLYQDNSVNELGGIPIMMYHGIVNKASSETEHTGGNVDVDGYNRTAEAFKKDLDKYYNEGYRMIRLIDYMNGNINVELGKSPIVLTFDDGHKNNINILGIDDKGNLKIDPNSAVGILESYKQKHPDFNVTATFFLNNALFEQPEYNEKIIKWLIDKGYDIGNHTKSHVNFKNCDSTKAQAEVASMYKLLDSIIPQKYVNIVALPYGSPGKKSHANFPLILSGISDGYSYETVGTLQVGWTYDLSPFHKNFDKTFLMRVRAWDNNGDTDIESTFKNLTNNRFISDGDDKTIVVKNTDNINTDITDKKVIKY